MLPIIRKRKCPHHFSSAQSVEPPRPPLLPQTLIFHTHPPQSYPSIKFVNKCSWDLFLFSFVFTQLWTISSPFWSSAQSHSFFLWLLQTMRSILFLLLLSKSSNDPVLGFRALKGCLQTFTGVAGSLKRIAVDLLCSLCAGRRPSSPLAIITISAVYTLAAWWCKSAFLLLVSMQEAK